MTCHNCQIKAVKAGRDRTGNQRFRCNKCKRRFQQHAERLLGNMYVWEDRALLSLQLLLEGMSLRSVERATGVNMHTLLKLLTVAGDHCEELMRRKIKGI